MNKISQRLVGFIGGAVGGAAVGGGMGTASGAVGAALLTVAGYAGYEVLEATKTIAMGNAVWCAASGGIAGYLVGSGFFKPKPPNTKTFFLGEVGYPAGMTLGGLIGYGLFMEVAGSTMTLGQIVASSALGAVVTAWPVTLGVLCCLAAIAIKRADEGREISEILKNMEQKVGEVPEDFEKAQATNNTDFVPQEEDKFEVRIAMN